MKKSILIFIFLFLLSSEMFAGIISGRIYRNEICGIPPQTCPTNNWDQSSIRIIKLVRPDGSIAANQNWSTNGIWVQSINAWQDYYINSGENITEYKLYVYAVYNGGAPLYSGKWIAIATVPTNGASFFNITMEKFDENFSPILSLDYNCEAPNPFNACQFNPRIKFSFNGNSYARTIIEQSFDQSTWTEIANVSPGLNEYVQGFASYPDPYNVQRFFRIKKQFVYPVNMFTLTSQYSQVKDFTILCNPIISGPTRLKSNQTGTWTIYPSGSEYQWLKKINGNYVEVGTSQYYSDQMTSGNLELLASVKICGTYWYGYGHIIVDCSNCISNEDAISEIKTNQISGNIPEKFSLNQNYPNPFNPTTKIKFEIAKASNVKLTIYDLTGKEIAEIFNGLKPAGYYEAEFDASKLASRVYYYKLVAGDFSEIRKMLLLK